jgi:Aldo/keto reductase family
MWRILQLQRKGKTRSIGVSNWSIPFLEKLLANATIPPAANQVREKPLPPFFFEPRSYLLSVFLSRGAHLSIMGKGRKQPVSTPERAPRVLQNKRDRTASLLASRFHQLVFARRSGHCQDC